MTDTRLRTAVVVTGVGVHSDPWHGLEATSAAASALLAPDFEVRDVTTDELAHLGDADLVVLNVSGDLAEPTTDSRRIVDVLLTAHESGTPILALHSSSLAFRDDERFAELLGGRWVPGVTMHPQIGVALVQPAEGSSRAAAFEVYDERYTALERRDDTQLVAFHTEDGLTHPLVWERDATDVGGAVAYDALGHGVESYLAEGHAQLFRALVARLVGDADAAPSEKVAPLGRAAAAVWGDVTVEAVGYELIAVSAGHASASAASATFDDAYLAPDRRLLVAGYLALEGDDTGLLWAIGHGRVSAELAVDANGLHVRALPSARIDGDVLRAPDAGLAIVAESGTWRPTPDGIALTGDGWRAVIVHGPAAAKVENRIRLRDDIRRLARPEGSEQ